MSSWPRPLAWSGGSLGGGRPAVMAILNLTADSFFDGGRYESLQAAQERAWEVVEEGADVLDLGGESSRPGSEGVSEEEELARVLPVLDLLRSGPRPYPLPISVDTSRARVAQEALEAGASIINDISGGTREPRILEVTAEHGAAIVLMHMRGTPRTMQDNVAYEDLIDETRDQLASSCATATAAGIPPERQAIDPGIGFGKSPEGCLDLIGNLSAFAELQRPILVGASRKSFLGRAFGHGLEERLEGSLSAAALSVAAGASILRVHDVLATRRAVDVAARIRDSRR
ncbi:MAG: dihydropteroate synthase [Myxococcota bacterium]|nr:dihydropteroate synthase [Myxococcota bacterium]